MVTIITRRDYLVNSHEGMALCLLLPFPYACYTFFFFFCTQAVSLSTLWKGRSPRPVTPGNSKWNQDLKSDSLAQESITTEGLCMASSVMHSPESNMKS